MCCYPFSPSWCSHSCSKVWICIDYVLRITIFSTEYRPWRKNPCCVWEGRVLVAWLLLELFLGSREHPARLFFETLPSLNPEKCSVIPFFFSLTGPFLPCLLTNSAAQAAAANPAFSRSWATTLSPAFRPTSRATRQRCSLPTELIPFAFFFWSCVNERGSRWSLYPLY